MSAEVRGHRLAAVPDDDDGVLGVQAGGRGEDVAEHRASGEAVQDLGGAGLHPGALAGGEDDDREQGHWSPIRSAGSEGVAT